MSFTFDANILFYAADVSAGDKHRVALDLVSRAAVGGGCVLTLQSLAEFYVAITRKGKLGADEASDHVHKWRAVFPVHPASENCLIDAMKAVREHKLSFWDAMLWAAAKEAGRRLLISEDFHDGRTIGSVTFIDPFQGHNEVLLRAALPPT